MKDKAETADIATNRKASFNFQVLERAEAGLVLLGSEVKSLRDGGLSFKDAYIDHRAGELYMVGCHIAPYSHGTSQNHAPERDRKLLLHKREIVRLAGKATEKGLTLVPLRVYFKNGKIKLEIALARGKHAHDKRHAIREREMERETRQAVRARR